MAEVANAFEDDRAAGDTIAEAAMKHGLIVRQVVAADRNGMTPEGEVADIPLVPDFLEQVFQIETGDESDLFMTMEGGAYAVKMNSITPPAVKPLDQVREQVREAFIADARTKLLQTRVQTLTHEARKSGSLAEAGRALTAHTDDEHAASARAGRQRRIGRTFQSGFWRDPRFDRHGSGRFRQRSGDVRAWSTLCIPSPT